MVSDRAQLDEVERSIERIREILRCFLCRETVENPYRVQNCNHSFCYDCVADAVEENNQCPACSLPAYPRELVQNKQLRNLLVGYSALRDEAAKLHASEPPADDDGQGSQPEGPTRPLEIATARRRSGCGDEQDETAQSKGRRLCKGIWSSDSPTDAPGTEHERRSPRPPGTDSLTDIEQKPASPVAHESPSRQKKRGRKRRIHRVDSDDYSQPASVHNGGPAPGLSPGDEGEGISTSDELSVSGFPTMSEVLGFRRTPERIDEAAQTDRREGGVGPNSGSDGNSGPVRGRSGMLADEIEEHPVQLGVTRGAERMSRPEGLHGADSSQAQDGKRADEQDGGLPRSVPKPMGESDPAPADLPRTKLDMTERDMDLREGQAHQQPALIVTDDQTQMEPASIVADVQAHEEPALIGEDGQTQQEPVFLVSSGQAHQEPALIETDGASAPHKLPGGKSIRMSEAVLSFQHVQSFVNGAQEADCSRLRPTVEWMQGGGVTVAFTNVRSADDIGSLCEMAEYLGAEVVEAVEDMDLVSHLVSGVNRRGSIVHRSIKLISAVAGRKHVVTVEWLKTSASLGAWQEERDYVPSDADFVVSAGGRPAFRDVDVAFIGSFEPPEPPRAHLEMLVRHGGGQVVQPASRSNECTVLVLDEASYAARAALEEATYTAVFSSNSILEAVLSGKCIADVCHVSTTSSHSEAVPGQTPRQA